MSTNIFEPLTQSSSASIWDIVWSEHFPYQLDSQTSVHISNYLECSTFSAQYFEEIYKTPTHNSRFIWFEKSKAKENFYKNADFFKFISNSRMIGMFVGNPLDWSTYYLRNISILNEYQGKSLFPKFLNYLEQILTVYHLHRMQTEVSPTNTKTSNILLKQGFKITGLNLSERWGALNIMTKFISLDHKQVFDYQFCHHIESNHERRLQ